MTLNEYQEKARTTAIYPNQGNNWVYAPRGLVGEAGEVAEKMKKAIRDDGGVITPERKEMIVKELGDVLWYIAILAVELGVDLDTIATANLEKLFSRKDRGVLTGSGDER